MMPRFQPQLVPELSNEAKGAAALQLRGEGSGGHENLHRPIRPPGRRRRGGDVRQPEFQKAVRNADAGLCRGRDRGGWETDPGRPSRDSPEGQVCPGPSPGRSSTVGRSQRGSSERHRRESRQAWGPACLLGNTGGFRGNISGSFVSRSLTALLTGCTHGELLLRSSPQGPKQPPGSSLSPAPAENLGAPFGLWWVGSTHRVLTLLDGCSKHLPGGQGSNMGPQGAPHFPADSKHGIHAFPLRGDETRSLRADQ